MDEAGDAQRLPARLDDASKKLLAKLHTPDGPLQAHVDAWLDEAKQLGALEERREHLARQLATGASGPTAAEVVAARHAWIRVIRALESNLALESKADAETVEKILGPVRRAEAKADRRKGASKNNGADAEETTDVTPVEETAVKDDGKAETAATKGAMPPGSAGTPDAPPRTKADK